ncbi:MAG: hypothetical protein JNL70_15540 [Saprospiraceae bacterium]|nr:hypothetical protein [Saprospiraceae bacterium]
MKIKYILISTLFVFLVTASNAQNFSTWIQDASHKGLKVRYAINKDAFGYNTVILELTNTILSSMEVTTSICSTEGQGKNGWQQISIQPNKIVRLSFKVKNNACVNGWWWWYRSYSESRSTNIFGN